MAVWSSARHAICIIISRRRMLFLALGRLVYEPIGAYNTHEYAPRYDESGRFTAMNGAAWS